MRHRSAVHAKKTKPVRTRNATNGRLDIQLRDDDQPTAAADFMNSGISSPLGPYDDGTFAPMIRR